MADFGEVFRIVWVVSLALKKVFEGFAKLETVHGFLAFGKERVQIYLGKGKRDMDKKNEKEEEEFIFHGV